LPNNYVIGIDLGTTNCALAYALHTEDPREPAPVALFEVPQLVNPGEVRDEPLLPSFLYLPGSSDFPAGSIGLPWDETAQYVVGALAQKRGAEVASRLVASAKSWLSHPGVDRTAPILPWGAQGTPAPEGIAKVSPVEASRRYLEHLREAWDFKQPDAPFSEQQALVTVPASFDAVARELTLRAAEEAASCVLRLDRAASRLARARGRGRSDSGGGYWRRHYGLHADRGYRAGRRIIAGSRGGGRTHPAGRR
jgi:molecular chaperone DnaK (HSP70)